MTAAETFGDIRIDDLRTLLVVARTASIAAAARDLRVSSSRVSKILARLESRFGRPLVTRGTRGIGLTEAGEQLLPEIAGLIDRFGRFVQRTPTALVELTLAAEPYLLAMCQPAIAAASPTLRVRGIALAKAELRADVSDARFDVALVTSRIDDLPTSWRLEPIGRMPKGLFTTQATAERLGTPPIEPAALHGEPFVSPTKRSDIGSAEDDCPLRFYDRVLGHQTDTMSVGLEVAARTGQVIFGPIALARPYVDAGRLVEVKVRGWHVCPDLFLLCHVDRVPAKVLRGIRRELALVLDEAVSRSASSP